MWVSLVITICFSNAQPLLPDGNFEVIKTNSCNQPDDAFEQLAHWYPLDASPDLFIDNCQYDESGSFFWDKDFRAFAGNRFIGLSCRWNSNETYVSEGIATQLSAPLEAGEVYFVELAIRNMGGYQGFDEDVSPCNLRPDQYLAIYLSEDSIFVENNFANGTSSTTAKLATKLSNEVIQSRTRSLEWTIVSGCFKAQGGERFLGISMPLGDFGELPACAASANSGVFRSFYFQLDDLMLKKVPKVWEKELKYCEGEPMEVDLPDLFKNTFLESAQFEWADGNINATRIVKTAGQYSIVAKLDCDKFGIELVVRQEDCVPKLYAPTIFSPNGDGINDLFEISFGKKDNITDYKLQIFNRWGALVFESQSVEESWDGKNSGKLVAEGTYIWRMYHRYGEDEEQAEMGSVELLR
ncbi:MAG: gliding motility-associated C-terminal domain-containing protein [Bacteroidota bacterium]